MVVRVVAPFGYLRIFSLLLRNPSLADLHSETNGTLELRRVAKEVFSTSAGMGERYCERHSEVEGGFAPWALVEHRAPADSETE